MSRAALVSGGRAGATGRCSQRSGGASRYEAGCSTRFERRAQQFRGAAATRVLPVRREQPIALERVLAWTVALDLEPAAVDWIDLVRGVGTFDGILVSDPAVLDELAELRMLGLLLDPFTSELAVRDSLGRTYPLLLRDELPAAASSAVRSASDVAVQRAASQ